MFYQSNFGAFTITLMYFTSFFFKYQQTIFRTRKDCGFPISTNAAHLSRFDISGRGICNVSNVCVFFLICKFVLQSNVAVQTIRNVPGICDTISDKGISFLRKEL